MDTCLSPIVTMIFHLTLNVCQRMRNYAASNAPLKSTPIKSQIVIVSSTEMPLSSDDSETIDVGNERADAVLNL